MDWISKLKEWNVPYAEGLSTVLDARGLDPDDFSNIFELYNYLSSYMRTVQIERPLLFEECFPPPGTAWYCPIVHFLNYVYQEYIAPYMIYVGIMAAGGVSTWLLPDKWKVVGVGAVIAGMLGIYKTIVSV